MRERFHFSKKEKQILISSALIIIIGQLTFNYLKSRPSSNQISYNIHQVNADSSIHQSVADSKTYSHVGSITVNEHLEPKQTKRATSLDPERTNVMAQVTKRNKQILDTPYFIDINLASSEEWQKIKGIGPTYSRRILGFRKALGGFYSIDQVGETYYLPDSVFEKISPFLRLSTPHDRFNINESALDSTFRHPYLAPWELEMIREHIQQNGSIEDLNSFQGLFADKLKSIKHLEQYVSFR